MKQEKTQLFKMNYKTFKQELVGTFDSLQDAQRYVTTHSSQFEGYSVFYNII